jgi:hypothetical protein
MRRRSLLLALVLGGVLPLPSPRHQALVQDWPHYDDSPVAAVVGETHGPVHGSSWASLLVLLVGLKVGLHFLGGQGMQSSTSPPGCPALGLALSQPRKSHT